MNDPPRVAMLGLGWFPDQANGLDRFFTELGHALTHAGTPVRAVVCGPADEPPPWLDVPVDAQEGLPVRLHRFARAAATAARSADVVDAHFALYAAAALTRRSVRAHPFVVHFQGPWADESRMDGDPPGWRIGAKRGLERLVYGRADAAITLSTSFKRLLVERYRVPPWVVRVVPPGVDVERFRPADPVLARRRWSVEPTTFLAVTARRLIRRTGIDVALAAWAELDHDDRMLLVLSDGPERPALERLAAELGITDVVRFLGKVSDEDLIDAYRAADVSLVPSRELEGYGLVVLESLACGTPVIASDNGGLAEALAPMGAGLVTPAGDATALARRLQRAIEGTQPLPGEEECRAHAAASAWSRVAAAHAAVYADVVGGGGDGIRRVVITTHTAQPSGAELSLLRLAPALRDAGVDVHVIVASAGPLVSRLEAAGVSVEVVPMAEGVRTLSRHEVRVGPALLGSVIGSARYTVRLARRLRALRPDVVHTYSLKSALYGGAAARAAGVPLVWHIHDRIASDYLPGPAVAAVRRMSRLLPDVVIANSRASADTLPSTRHPVIVVPEPLPARSGTVERAVAPGPPLRIGLVGRMSPWKGQDLFLRAFARAFPDGDAEAVLVGGALFGEHAYADAVSALAAELGLEHRVRFLGHVDDVEAELAQMHVLVHTSLIPEPFGMAVIEGMAHGLAVVASRSGGPAEVIHDGVDGILYEMGDESALVSALQRVASDPALRARLGAAARSEAERYRPSALVAPVLQAYDDAILRRRGYRR